MSNIHREKTNLMKNNRPFNCALILFYNKYRNLLQLLTKRAMYMHFNKKVKSAQCNIKKT